MSSISNPKLVAAGKAADEALYECDKIAGERSYDEFKNDPRWQAAHARYTELYEVYQKLKREAFAEYGGPVGGELLAPDFTS